METMDAVERLRPPSKQGRGVHGGGLGGGEELWAAGELVSLCARVGGELWWGALGVMQVDELQQPEGHGGLTTQTETGMEMEMEVEMEMTDLTLADMRWTQVDEGSGGDGVGIEEAARG